jgi:hypothetical protein
VGSKVDGAANETTKSTRVDRLTPPVNLA